MLATDRHSTHGQKGLLLEFFRQDRERVRVQDKRPDYGDLDTISGTNIDVTLSISTLFPKQEACSIFFGWGSQVQLDHYFN